MAIVTASNTINFTFAETISYGIGPTTQNFPTNVAFRSVFTTAGILLDQCNLIYAATISLSASTPVNLDLTNLTDLEGAVADFARVRFVAIRNNSQVDADIVSLFENGTNDWVGINSGAATATTPIYPSSPKNDGFSIFQMPNSTGAIVGASNKIIKINPGSLAKTVDLLIAGCNA